MVNLTLSLCFTFTQKSFCCVKLASYTEKWQDGCHGNALLFLILPENVTSIELVREGLRAAAFYKKYDKHQCSFDAIILNRSSLAEKWAESSKSFL